MRTINLVHEMKEFKKEAPNPPCLVIITAKQNTVTKMSEAPLLTDIMLQRKKAVNDYKTRGSSMDVKQHCDRIQLLCNGAKYSYILTLTRSWRKNHESVKVLERLLQALIRALPQFLLFP